MFFIILLVLSLVGCNNSAKPPDVRQELWDEAVQTYKMINDKASNGVLLNQNDMEKILMFESKYSQRNNKDTTESEQKIITSLLQLFYIKTELDKSIVQNDNTTAEIIRDGYIKAEKELEKMFNIKK